MRCLLWALAVIVVAVGATDPEAKRKASKFRAEGDAQLVSGNALGSLVHYSDAIKLEPTEVKNYLKRYKANDRLKRPAAMLQDLTLALEHCGKSDEVLLLRSSLLLSQGKCKLAAQDLQLLPPTAATADKLALAMQCAQLVDEADRVLSQGEFQRADELFTQAVDLIKTAAVDIKRRRALARHSRGDYFECIADAGEIVKQDRNDVEMLTLRGQAYFSLGDLDMAARHTSEALQSDPEFAQAKKLHKTVSGIKRLLAQAKKLMEQGDLGGAMAKFEKIEVDYAPLPRITHRDLLLDMCRCSGKLKKREWVYKTCIASMQLDESWLDVRIAFAEILRDLADSTEELEEVVREWKKAMNLDQQNGHIHDQLRRAEAALKQSRTKNYYKILNVKRTATAGEVKKAYRDMAKKYHPDRHQALDAEEKKKMEKMFQDCAEAYEVLSDEEKKGKYDRGEDVFENQGHQHHQHNFHRTGGFHFGFGF